MFERSRAGLLPPRINKSGLFFHLDNVSPGYGVPQRAVPAFDKAKKILAFEMYFSTRKVSSSRKVTRMSPYYGTLCVMNIKLLLKKMGLDKKKFRFSHIKDDTIYFVWK
jgi:hypothetical protein